MNTRKGLKALFISLFILSGEAIAATDVEIANDLIFCGVVAEGGMQAAKNQEDKTQWEQQRTLYLGSASYLTSIAHIQEQRSIAMESRRKLFEENPTGEMLAQKISKALKSCKEQLLENYSKIMERSQSMTAKKDIKTNLEDKQSNADSKFTSGVTSSSEVISVLGKPTHEDQNTDGRFVYNYETQTGYDVYLFDKEKKLIRMRRYCDSLKGKCN